MQVCECESLSSSRECQGLSRGRHMAVCVASSSNFDVALFSVDTFAAFMLADDEMKFPGAKKTSVDLHVLDMVKFHLWAFNVKGVMTPQRIIAAATQTPLFARLTPVKANRLCGWLSLDDAAVVRSLYMKAHWPVPDCGPLGLMFRAPSYALKWGRRCPTSELRLLVDVRAFAVAAPASGSSFFAVLDSAFRKSRIQPFRDGCYLDFMSFVFFVGSCRKRGDAAPLVTSGDVDSAFVGLDALDISEIILALNEAMSRKP